MTERYPSDAALLALESDSHTGVEYIPTGKTPYFLEFRKLIHRLLDASRRANDLRVFADGDLTLGIRSGQCVIDNTVIDFAGTSAVAVTNNAVTHLWLDAAGDVQSSTTSLPTDRSTFLPLASITTSAGLITQITDLRGQALWHIPTLASLGLSVTALEIDQALAGVSSSVTAAALDRLTAGLDSNADADHTHHRSFHDTAGEAGFAIVNDNGDPAASAVLRFDLPNLLPDVTELLVDTATGFLQQRYQGVAHSLVGSVHAQYRHEGPLTASATGKVLGSVPIDGTITDVILSTRLNIDSSLTTDNVTAIVSVNGNPVTTTHPALSDAAGTGFKSTAQGHGTPAIVKSDGTQLVQRGDILTLDLNRTAAGSITTNATDLVVLLVIRPAKPE
jgi:hypothetical protein